MFSLKEKKKFTEEVYALWEKSQSVEEFLAHSENILQASERKQGPHNFDENKWGW